MRHLTLVTTAEPDESSDDAIVARVVAGETAAFELLMRRHNRRVFRAARAILGNDDEAEDAMQQAYASAFTHLREFGGRSRFSTWLVRIAVYEALGRLRRGKRFTSLDDAELEEEPVATTKNPEEAASDVEMRAVLEAAVDALPLGFRAVFVMRAVEEMSVHETAEALDLPEETVRTRHHRRACPASRERRPKARRRSIGRVQLHLSRCDRVVNAVLARIRG